MNLIQRWTQYRCRCKRLQTHLPFRLLRRLGSKVPFDCGGRSIQLSANGIGTWNWVLWNQSWRTQLMSHILGKRGGAFVDIGVNCGQTLADFITVRSPGRYIGFEPSPECVSFVNEILHRNQLSDCQVICTALADVDGLRSLSHLEGAFADCSATLHPEMWRSRQLTSRHVVCCAFDSIWPTLQEPDIALIKIDVEGAELDVLSGMKKTLSRNRPPVICEVLHKGEEIDPEHGTRPNDRLSDLVSELDYVILQVVKNEVDSEMDGLKEMAAFPNVRWSEENEHECDYLLVPQEEKAHYLSMDSSA